MNNWQTVKETLTDKDMRLVISPWHMKFEQVVKDAIESDVNSMEASSTEQAHTEAHENCGSQRRVRRPTKTVLTRCTHTPHLSVHIIGI